MSNRRWLRYVHWFGYFTSVIFVIAIAILANIAIEDWKGRQARRAATLMLPGPAAPRLTDYTGLNKEGALLSQLPSLRQLAPDGIRLIAQPSFGDTDFGLTLRRTLSGGEGVLIMRESETDNPSSRRVELKISDSAYMKLTSDLDALSASWKGESGWWTDGTPVMFERVNKGNVSSGVGNSPHFYGKVTALIFEAVRPSTPALARFDNTWHPRDQANVEAGSHDAARVTSLRVR